jgi:hypothetical protein
VDCYCTDARTGVRYGSGWSGLRSAHLRGVGNRQPNRCGEAGELISNEGSVVLGVAAVLPRLPRSCAGGGWPRLMLPLLLLTLMLLRRRGRRRRMGSMGVRGGPDAARVWLVGQQRGPLCWLVGVLTVKWAEVRKGSSRGPHALWEGLCDGRSCAVVATCWVRCTGGVHGGQARGRDGHRCGRDCCLAGIDGRGCGTGRRCRENRRCRSRHGSGGGRGCDVGGCRCGGRAGCASGCRDHGTDCRGCMIAGHGQRGCGAGQCRAWTAGGAGCKGGGHADRAGS